jgi:hypothetical protein
MKNGAGGRARELTLSWSVTVSCWFHAGLRALPQPRERVVRRQPRVPVERQVTRLRGHKIASGGLSLNERDDIPAKSRTDDDRAPWSAGRRGSRGCSAAARCRRRRSSGPARTSAPPAGPTPRRSTAAARRGARRRRYDACLLIFLAPLVLEETGAARRTSQAKKASF